MRGSRIVPAAGDAGREPALLSVLSWVLACAICLLQSQEGAW